MSEVAPALLIETNHRENIIPEFSAAPAVEEPNIAASSMAKVLSAAVKNVDHVN